MTATHWIAIAAIITPLATSWLQFWLKERSEKKKALAAASPPTSQPKTIDRLPVTLWGVIKRNWRISLISYFATWVSVGAILSVYWGAIPLTFNTGCLVVLCVILLILANLLPWGRDWR